MCKQYDNAPQVLKDIIARLRHLEDNLDTTTYHHFDALCDHLFECADIFSERREEFCDDIFVDDRIKLVLTQSATFLMLAGITMQNFAHLADDVDGLTEDELIEEQIKLKGLLEYIEHAEKVELDMVEEVAYG